MASRTFKDINLSFKRHPVTNDVLTISDEDAIKKSVKNIVFTLRTLISKLKTKTSPSLAESRPSPLEPEFLARGYVPCGDKEISLLVNKDEEINRLRKDWALYPDHVVFLGAKPAILETKFNLLDLDEIASVKPPFIFSIKEGFLTVAHAGEEGPPEYIWDSLNLLKIKRVDHGVQCLNDKKLVEKLVKDQTPLTVCPLSNVKLCVFDKLENHNLKIMLDKGLRVMVNSDDPAYFGGYLNQNLIETSRALNLELKDVKKLIQNSFKSSFLNDENKKDWLNKIN